MGLGAAVLRSVRVVLVAGGLVVAAVLALKIATLVLEPRLTFFPVRSYAAVPPDIGLPFEDVFIDTGDGARIHGWFVPGERASPGPGPRTAPPSKRAAILFFHGNAENISGGLDLAERTRRAGYDLLLIDYRGYGESSGRPSEEGLYRDGRAALAWLRSRPDIEAGRIVVWGRSIGSAVAVSVASDGGDGAAGDAAGPRPAGVILESPFTSVDELLRDGGHWLLWGLSRFGTYRFDSAARMGLIAAPVLIVHGTSDEIAPVGLGRRLFELAPGKKEFVAIEGGGHNDLWALHADRIWEAARRFVESLP